MLVVERRSRRSEVRSVALELLLEACRAKGGGDAVVIADRRGLLLASAATSSVSVDEVAAVLPEPARAMRVERLTVMPFRVLGETFFLGVVASAVAMADLDAAVAGTRRILAA